jgi:hypothetical protein
MANLTTLQVFGVPVLTYGLIGLTTGVLAYATSIDMGDSVSKSMDSISEITANPMGALTDATAITSEPASASDEPPPEQTEMPVESSPDSGVDEQPSATPEKTGGKRRRRKTPKSKKSKSRKTQKKTKSRRK